MKNKEQKNNLVIDTDWSEKFVTVGLIHNGKSYEARYSCDVLLRENIVWLGYKTIPDPSLQKKLDFAGVCLNDQDLLVYVNSYIEFLKNSL